MVVEYLDSEDDRNQISKSSGLWQPTWTCLKQIDPPTAFSKSQSGEASDWARSNDDNFAREFGLHLSRMQLPLIGGRHVKARTCPGIDHLRSEQANLISFQLPRSLTLVLVVV